AAGTISRQAAALIDAKKRQAETRHNRCSGAKTSFIGSHLRVTAASTCGFPPNCLAWNRPALDRQRGHSTFSCDKVACPLFLPIVVQSQKIAKIAVEG